MPYGTTVAAGLLAFAGAFAEAFLAFGMALAFLASLASSALKNFVVFSSSSDPSSVVWRVVTVRKREESKSFSILKRD